MKNMKRILALALVALAAIPVPASAQTPVGRYDQPVGGAIAAVSTDVGIVVKYVGITPAGGNLTVAANGDISLFTGAAGSGTVDLTTECPVVTTLGGIIDVSDAACDTMGEVVDAINSSPNWEASLVGMLRTDSSNDTLITRANGSASLAQGLALLKDTTVALNVTLPLYENPNDIGTYVAERTASPQVLNPNPFNDTQAYLMFAQGTFTGTGADNFDIISVKVDNRGGCPTATAATVASIICANKETVTTLLTVPGGGTTVSKAYDYTNVPFPFRKGEKALVRLRAASTFTAAVFSAGGFVRPFKAPR